MPKSRKAPAKVAKHALASSELDESIGLYRVRCTCGAEWTIAQQDHAEGKDGMDDHVRYGGS